MQEDVYWGDGLNLYTYCGNNPVVYYDPTGYSNQNNWLQNLADMTYEQKVESLYFRRDQLFQLQTYYNDNYSEFYFER